MYMCTQTHVHVYTCISIVYRYVYMCVYDTYYNSI